MHPSEHAPRLVEPRQPLVRLIVASLFATLLLAVQPLSAQTCPFDDGNSTLPNDGLVLTRYALGIRGAAMLANTDFATADPATVEAHIACPACGLRVTDDRDGLNNPIFTATDATIISRKLAGFSGNALTDGLALGSGSRNTPAAVNSFLLAGCGVTGGTVTSVTAGSGLAVSPNAVGGSITTSGTIGIAVGGVTNSRLGDASVSTSKIADGSVSQIKLYEAGPPSAAGQLLSTTGPNPTGSLTWVSPPTLSCTSANAANVTAAPGGQACSVAACPSGYIVTGGGTNAVGWASNGALANSAVYRNDISGNGWAVCYLNTSASSGDVTFGAYARCCKVD